MEVDLVDVVFWLDFTNTGLYPSDVEAPPFQVTETGWGEFEIQIKVYFVPEAGEKPLTLFHFLKIRPYNPEMPIEDPANPPPETSEPVYSQQYDEIIFNEPTEAFLE